MMIMLIMILLILMMMAMIADDSSYCLLNIYREPGILLKSGYNLSYLILQ